VTSALWSPVAVVRNDGMGIGETGIDVGPVQPRIVLDDRLEGLALGQQAQN
jgi:hypothetical protein